MQDKNYHPITLWRADITIKGLGLKENVKELIEGSDFIIAVLTTSILDGSNGLKLSNPNVLWELGYADCLGKPIVVLADNDSLRNLPILAGLPNICVYNHQIVIQSNSKEAVDTLKIIPKQLAPYIKKAITLSRSFSISGNRSRAMTYPNRDKIEFASMIMAAYESVDILTTNLHYFKSDAFYKDPVEPFQKALDNGATIRIVTLNPESAIAEYRAKQLGRGQNIPAYRKELRDGIIWFYDKFRNSSQFNLHIYNDLPLQITTRIDQAIFTSVITRGDRARKRIQIRFNIHDEGVTESFITHFQSMYEDSQDVTGITWVLRPEP